MPYEYVCHACEAISPERRDRREDAEDELLAHRRDAHGGLRPAAGDEVRPVHAQGRGEGLLPDGWPWALLALAVLLIAHYFTR